ncbi:MAG: phosphopentomutase [Clostridiales bacterium]|nr:phosphopentomutase [Clostridiales bacterium]
MSKKAVLIVLDSVGIGALPDAAAYGDAGADTLGHIINTCHPSLPNLMAMGLGNIDGASFPGAVPSPAAAYGRLREVSAGKDTTTGHWEIAGVQLSRPFPTFPNGFPQAFISRFEQAVGRQTIGNKPASGTAILDELGEEHIATGKLIVYTSADSVFQIAANEAVVPLEELYRDCEIAREMLSDELEVGRVIARPFVGERAGAFRRTGGRRDFSAMPPETMCDALAAAGKTVYGVGKIEDIFDHRGITKSNHAAGNPACMEATFAAMKEDFDGLLFVNLVDFDMVYGHRRDVQGYARALEEFDRQLPQIQALMGDEDMLVLTADHGCDPCHTGTDHTREHTPLLVWGRRLRPGINLGTRQTYADISATVLDFFGVTKRLRGTSFLGQLAP